MSQASPLVFDASSLLAFLYGERGGEVVRDLLQHRAGQCYAHSVNVLEVFYRTRRQFSRQRADDAVQVLDQIGLIDCQDIDRDFLYNVGEIKVGLAAVPLADCFCVALAQRLGAEVVTADHPDFDRVAQHRLCAVLFIR